MLFFYCIIRVKNITLLKKLKKKFEIPKKVEAILNSTISIWFSDDEPFEVIMQIDNYVSKYFINKPISSTQKIISEDRNSIIISLFASNDMEIIPIVKSWMPFIKVISPTRIQESVKEEARKFLE